VSNLPDRIQPLQKNNSVPLLRRLLANREAGVLLALIVLVAVMSLASPYFLKPLNLFNVMRGMSTIGIMCIGVAMVIIKYLFWMSPHTASTSAQNPTSTS